jgi:hypothetical protein
MYDSIAMAANTIGKFIASAGKVIGSAIVIGPERRGTQYTVLHEARHRPTQKHYNQ